MASSSAFLLLGSSDETVYGTKLMRLILDGGTEALINVFRRIHPGDLQVVLSRTCSSSTSTSCTCNYWDVINQMQWDKLYPAPPNKPNIHDYDITLLSVLLRSICGLSPPSVTGWDKLPTSADFSSEADIVRIKLYRNEYLGHKSKTAVSEAVFKALWKEISLPLVRLGIDQKEIERLENEECGDEDIKRILNVLEEDRNVWNDTRNDVEEIKDVVHETWDVLKEIRNTVKEPASDDLLKKHLVRFDFQNEIDSFSRKCTTGSREWVFEQIFTWFNKVTSETRAFVISDHAGMGKSVIAAVVCKRFAQHLGASHFFKYNDCQYNNPNFFLQSLAWHLCKVIPPYKDAVVEKLSGNLGKSLNDMNLHGLFSILFKEPFTEISDPGKHILIVLDALDESEYKGRDELAEFISSRFNELPSYLRFLITTRLEKNIVFAFRGLNPLSMQNNCEENFSDIKLVLQDKISSWNQPSPDFIDNLAQKCDGSMFYAFVLTEMYKENISISNIDSLPENVERYYVHCFKRLESELNELVGVHADSFLFFLSALAVAKEPLPEGFLRTIFGFDSPADAMYKVAKAINVLSSHFVIREDKCISFSHKSIKDWLVDPSRDNYPRVNLQYGHKILFHLCVGKLDELKQKGVSRERVASLGVSYALKHWITHMMDRLEDAEELEGFVESYLIDLEVVFASVLLDINVASTSLETYDEISERMSTNARVSSEIVKELHSLILKFAFSLQEHPKTFFQIVVNESGEQLSSKASDLLQTRYKDIFYFKSDRHGRGNDAVYKVRFYLSGYIVSIDVSPNHDYIVCGYSNGGIELFSSATGKSEWIMKGFPLSFSDSCCIIMYTHSVVFHPCGNLVFPSILDEVLTLDGKLRTGPFHCDEDSSKFSNSCFSADGSRMATTYGKHLYVWDVSSGNMERCLRCTLLRSLSFATNGNFLATTGCDYVFTVYDVTNDYKVNYKRIESKGFPSLEIVSTFDHNSWLCSVNDVLRRVSHDFVFSSDFGSVTDLPLPGNDHSSLELHRFLRHPKTSWLSKAKRNKRQYWFSDYYHLGYYILEHEGDKNVLFFSRAGTVMSVFNIEDFAQKERSASNTNEMVLSSISSNGCFVYLSNHSTENFYVCKLSSKVKCSITRDMLDFLVVRDGLFFYSSKHACIPELWNSDVSECLSSFDQLTGATDCRSVSDEVVACVFQKTASKCSFRIVFFNVSANEIVKEMSIDANKRIYEMSVLACSIKYHVFTKEGDECLLWVDGEKVDGFEGMFPQVPKLGSVCAEFSPDGKRFVLYCDMDNKISIYDVASESFLATITVGRLGLQQVLKFFDNENVLCCSVNAILYLWNINSCEVLASFVLRDNKSQISVCRENNIVCIASEVTEDFELLTVFPPRRHRSHTSSIN